MFISDAYAQTAAGAAGAGDPTMALIMQLAPFVLMFGVFYFLIMRP